MHFANLLSSFLAAGLLAAPSTCQRGLYDRDVHTGDIYARDSFEQGLYERDLYELSLYERDLDEPTLYGRDLYERDFYGPAFYRRAGKTAPVSSKQKASPVNPKLKTAPANSKLKSTHKKAVPKRCLRKRDALERLYTRAVKEVEAGTSQMGEPEDELKTWNLKTCIGVVGLSDNGKKVMGHLSAINDLGSNYETQLAAVRSSALAIGGKITWTASTPDENEGGEELSGPLRTMINYVVNTLDGLQPEFNWIQRGLRQAGKMSVIKEVVHDSCVY